VAIAVPAYVPVLTAYTHSSIMFLGFFCALLAGVGVWIPGRTHGPIVPDTAEVEDMLKIRVLAAVPRQAVYNANATRVQNSAGFSRCSGNCFQDF